MLTIVHDRPSLGSDFQFTRAEIELIQNCRMLSEEARQFIGGLSRRIAQREACERKQAPKGLRLISATREDQ